MDRPTQDYYEAVLETFNSAGWKFLMEDFVKLLDGFEQQGWNISSADEMLVMKGMIQQQRYVNSLPDSIEAAYEHLKLEESQSEVT